MTRVLVLGVTGMLGNALFRELSRNAIYEVRGTVRGERTRSFFSRTENERIISGVDITSDYALLTILKEWRPSVVINAIGIVKQLPTAKQPLVTIPINAVFPHRLAQFCELIGSRMIQLSTDCVFSGRRGGYTELDSSDAEDLYGRSKFLGEIPDHENVLTIRTSGIGHELSSRNGLLEWFLSQRGEVRGYSRAIYSGLPTVELARVISEVVLPHSKLSGLYQIAASPISKLALLRLIADVYGKTINIIPDDSVVADRSLDSRMFTVATGYTAPEWPQLVSRMHATRPSSP